MGLRRKQRRHLYGTSIWQRKEYAYIRKGSSSMNHEDVKKIYFQNDEIKKEYDNLEAVYTMKAQIIDIRNQMGISQKDLAELIGTKQSAISRLESGNYNPSIEFLDKVAHALGGHLQISIVRE
jgi:DNA-binding XRE family transcriptional regulator